MLPSGLLRPCAFFPGTFSVAPMLALLLLSITTVLPLSKLGARSLPMSEDSAPLLAHTRTKGQEQWNTHPPH